MVGRVSWLRFSCLAVELFVKTAHLLDPTSLQGIVVVCACRERICYAADHYRLALRRKHLGDDSEGEA
jgi:hypothetical protein